jgi:hypothetical protein
MGSLGHILELVHGSCCVYNSRLPHSCTEYVPSSPDASVITLVLFCKASAMKAAGSTQASDYMQEHGFEREPTRERRWAGKPRGSRGAGGSTSKNK